MKTFVLAAILGLCLFALTNSFANEHGNSGNHPAPPPFSCDWFFKDKHDCKPPKPPKDHCNKCEDGCNCCKDDEDDNTSESNFDTLVMVLYPNMGINELPEYGAMAYDISSALNPRKVFKDAVSSAKLQLANAVANGEIPNKAKYVLVARWRGYVYTKKLVARL